MKNNNTKRYKTRRASKLIYVVRRPSDGMRIHEYSPTTFVTFSHLNVSSVLSMLRMNIKRDVYVSGVHIPYPFGYYTLFRPSGLANDRCNCTKWRYAKILSHITQTCGVFRYKSKLYYCDSGSLYTYPDFVPVMLNICIESSQNIIAIDKTESDRFIKGFANIVQTGVFRYKKIYAKNIKVRVVCIQSFREGDVSHASTSVIRSFIRTCNFNTNPIGFVDYSISEEGAITGHIRDINMDTTSVNYLNRL